MKRFALIAALLVPLLLSPTETCRAADHPNVASLDATTFVITNGASVFLLKVEDGRVVLKDAVLLFTKKERSVVPSFGDAAIMRRQPIENQ